MNELVASLPQAEPALLAWWAAPSVKRKPLLVMIEDDVAIAEMYRLQLRADGYDVEMAADGKRGLALLRRRPADLVLLDIRLPELHGFQVLEQIRADATLGGIPVVVLSNFGDPGLIAQGRRLGARAYLIKSDTTPAQLSAVVRRMLGAEPADQ